MRTFSLISAAWGHVGRYQAACLGVRGNPEAACMGVLGAIWRFTRLRMRERVNRYLRSEWYILAIDFFQLKI